jgi:hypothetical protein
MSNDQYSSTVIAYLRRYPQVTDIEPPDNTRGAHRRLRFRVNGKAVTLTINAHNNPNAGGSVDLKLQDVRRLLGGPPPEEASKVARSLADMDPKTYKPVHTIPCSVSVYRRSGANNDLNRVAIVVPDDVAVLLGPKTRIVQLDPNAWLLRADPHGSCRATSAGRAGYKAFIVNTDLLTRFARSPAEGVWVDGSLHIYSNPTLRRPLNEYYQNPPKPTQVAAAEPAPTAPEPAPTAPEPAPTADPVVTMSTIVVATTITTMRRLLTEIAAVERASPYRLMRLADGSVVWRAPTVRLEQDKGC